MLLKLPESETLALLLELVDKVTLLLELTESVTLALLLELGVRLTLVFEVGEALAVLKDSSASEPVTLLLVLGWLAEVI